MKRPQYISKSALVAEIKKIYNEDYKFLPSDIVEGVQDFKDDLLMNLDTLETKDVDLEKEIDENYQKDTSTLKTKKQYAEIAKHFFELGMSVNNKAQKGE